MFLETDLLPSSITAISVCKGPNSVDAFKPSDLRMATRIISETALIPFGIQDGQSPEPNNPLELIYWGNLTERDHLGDPSIDRRIILIWIFRKWDVEVWTRSIWLWIGTGGRHS